MDKKSLLLLASTLLLSLFLAEYLARLAGFEPWTGNAYSKRTSIHESDPILGWRLQPGEYHLPPYAPGEAEIHYTILGDGSRATGPDTGPNPSTTEQPKIVFVGGSYTQGWAISDSDTFAWKLQQRFPSLAMLNFGVGGYGTYQSLLRLEQSLPDLGGKKIVIYGFIEHHEVRNIASTDWLEALARFSEQPIHLPYVTVNTEHRLDRHPLTSYPTWPLRQHSALVSLAQKAYESSRSGTRAAQKTEATKLLMANMDQLVRQNGGQLLVVFLAGSAEKLADYQGYLDEQGVRTANCVFPMTADKVVKGEGHPNGAMNSQWAECLSNPLAELTQ